MLSDPLNPDHIRVFHDADDAVNFVDNRNVVVGYRDEQQCCEYVFYMWLDENYQPIFRDHRIVIADFPVRANCMFDNALLASLPCAPKVHEGFWFDTCCLPVKNTIRPPETEEECDSDNYTNFVTFRAVNADGVVRYLRIYNNQNGYYCHGWQLTAHDEVLVEGHI